MSAEGASLEHSNKEKNHGLILQYISLIARRIVNETGEKIKMICLMIYFSNSPGGFRRV